MTGKCLPIAREIGLSKKSPAVLLFCLILCRKSALAFLASAQTAVGLVGVIKCQTTTVWPAGSPKPAILSAASAASNRLVPYPSSKIDPQLVSRIKTAYRLAVSGNGPTMPPESDDAIARVPEDLIATGLFHGFYSLAHDLGLD